jgi:outer membrane protein
MQPRRILATLALVLPLLLPAFAHAAEMKLAYVDLQRALQETEEGKATKQQLQSMLSAKQAEIDKQQEELRKEKELLDKQASAMSEQTRNQKVQEFQAKVMQLGEKFQKERQAMQLQQQQALNGILERMEGVIKVIADRENITMVFDKSGGLIYAPSSLDLTNELIREYNAKYKGAAKSHGKKK